MDEKLLLIYDGDCRFCRFGMQLVRNLESSRRALDFCPFGRPAAEERLSVLPAAERYEAFHAARGDELYSGADAARETLRELPFGWILVAMGVHRVYPLLARYRGTLGRFVPDWAAVLTCGDEREPVG